MTAAAAATAKCKKKNSAKQTYDTHTHTEKNQTKGNKVNKNGNVKRQAQTKNSREQSRGLRAGSTEPGLEFEVEWRFARRGRSVRQLAPESLAPESEDLR